MMVLGIETSCDETAAAVVSAKPPVLRGHAVFSQTAEAVTGDGSDIA